MATKLALSGDRSISEIARELYISSKTLYSWMRKHKKEYDLLEAGQSDDPESEIKRLKKRERQIPN